LEAAEALRHEAFPPLADGVPVASQLLGELLVGGVLVGRRVEDEATAKGQGLGRGTRTDQGLQLLAQVRGEYDTRGKGPWHDVPPCNRRINESDEGVIMARVGTFVQTLAANL
jgi:hypothetical protein